MISTSFAKNRAGLFAAHRHGIRMLAGRAAGLFFVGDIPEVSRSGVNRRAGRNLGEKLARNPGGSEEVVTSRSGL